MSGGAIDAYLAQLECELRLKRAPRRRLLAETADHLRSCADEIASEGVRRKEAERGAVERFGAAAHIAGRFAYAAASTSARVALVWVAAAFAGYAVAAMLFVVAAPSWLLDFPQGAPSMLALQVALVALVLSGLRARPSRNALIMDEARLRLVANGVLISALAVAVAAGLELLLALTRPAAAPWGEASGLIVVYATVAVAALSAGFIAVANAARASAVAGLPRRSGAELSAAAASLVDDVAAVARPLTAVAAFVVSRPRRSCALVAACAFVAMTVSGGGTDVSRHASIFLGAAAAGLFEAAAVVAAYLVLGRPLGLRPNPDPQETADLQGRTARGP